MSSDEILELYHIFIRLASLGGGSQAHVHMEGKKCRVLYLNLLGTIIIARHMHALRPTQPTK